MTGRSIPRAVDPPPLGAAEIERIGRTVFQPSRVVAADVLIVFGTIHARWERLALACRAGLYRRIVLTGGRGPGWEAYGTEIARGMQRELAACGMNGTGVTLQDRSHNTLEDVAFSLELIAGSGDTARIAFASKAPHSGRCWLTLRRFFPRAALIAHHLPSRDPGVDVVLDRWWHDPEARRRVYAEFLRIVTYAARGDIAPPPD